MSDDSLFREVDEDIRRERFEQLWQRYGTYAIAVCVGVILAVAGLKGWQHWQRVQAENAGAAYHAALELSSAGKKQEGETAFAELARGSHTGAAVLARLKAADLMAGQGDVDGAVKAYDAVAADQSVERPLRDLARIRGAYLLADKASPEEIRQRVGPLQEAGNPWRHSARELVAIAAYRSSDYTLADRLVNEILADLETPAGLRQRAQAMASLLTPLVAGKASAGN